MKIKKRKFVISLAFCLSLGLGSQVFASGIPTVDVSAITQAVLQLQQLQQAYQTQLQQYNTAVNQLKNFTGNRGFGTLKYDLNLRNLIPQDVQSRLNSILSGTGTLSNLGKQFFEKFELGRACEQLEGEPKEYCLRSQNYKAETAAALQQGQNTVAQRLQNIESLMSKINEAEDAKAIADLSARIQAEQVALNASQFAEQFQQAQMAQQSKALEEAAKKKAFQEMFPPITEADLDNLLAPVNKPKKRN